MLVTEQGGEAFIKAVDLIQRCASAPGGGGTVLVSGLGKSGLIGAKISATLASLGVTSPFRPSLRSRPWRPRPLQGSGRLHRPLVFR